MNQNPKKPADFEPYLKALLTGDKQYGSRLVKALYHKDLRLDDIYEQIIKKALYRVGELWEQNLISVASEHMATAITEAILNELYGELPLADETGKNALVTCVEGEQHQVGARMVADVFELNGWNTYFLGANTPLPDLLAFAQTFNPQLIALSFSIYFNLAALHRMLKAIREQFPDIPIIVGGQGFRHGGAEILDQYQGIQLLPDLYALEQHLKTTHTP